MTYANDPFLGQIGKELHVHQGCHHALQRPKLRVNAQREEHEEKEHGPELCTRKLIDCLRENDKSQSSARCTLQEN